MGRQNGQRLHQLVKVAQKLRQWTGLNIMLADLLDKGCSILFDLMASEEKLLPVIE